MLFHCAVIWSAGYRLASTVDGQSHLLVSDCVDRHDLLCQLTAPRPMHSTTSIQLLSNALQQSELCLAEYYTDKDICYTLHQACCTIVPQLQDNFANSFASLKSP